MYPLSSRNARARKRINMLGRKVRIPPTPATIPSTIRDISHREVPIASSTVKSVLEPCSNPTSKYPFRKSPTVKVRKNTTAMIPRKIGIPHTECVRRLSIRSVMAACRALLNRHSSITSSM